MLDDASVQTAAQRLFDNHRERRPRTPLPEASGATLDDAYRIQEALQTLLLQSGEGPIVGYKIALTSAAMQQMCGVDHPLAGAVFAAGVHRSPARLALDRFVKLGVEFEVAAVLGADLPPGEPHSRASVASAVAALQPAFELVEDRQTDYATLEAFSLIADNCWNAGAVLGKPVTDWQTLDLIDAPTRLWINDEPAGQGKAGDAMGHPLEVVAWVANLLNKQGKMLRKDMLVLTGSSIVTQFPAAGDRLRFTVDGLGEVELAL